MRRRPKIRGFPYAAIDAQSIRSLVFLGMLIAGVATLTGCANFRSFFRHRNSDPFAGIPRPRFSDDPQLEEVVDHLNRNVEKLHSWQASSVSIRANNIPLSGTLAVEEGQHLRLVVNSMAGNEVDMGSNDDVFWICAKRMEPPYVFCEHDKIDRARQTLGVPFEPQWLMQALGVAPLDNKDLRMQIDPTSRRARLVQPILTAHGYPLQKVMMVDLIHGVILEHSIIDGAGQTIAQARLEDFRYDKKSGSVLPRRVRLDWPQNRMSLVMTLGPVDVNPTSIPSQIWEMPQPRAGIQFVDLGAESPAGIRYVDRGNEPQVELLEPEDAAPSGEVAQGHRNEQRRMRDQAPGRIRLTDSPTDVTPSKAATNRQDRSKLVEPIRFSSEENTAKPSKENWFDD